MTSQEIASRMFAERDQLLFASASGDYNPMHMDAVAARRTQATAPVVHGIHALIWSIDELQKSGFSFNNVKSIRIEFLKFIYLDRRVALVFTSRSEKSVKLAITDEGLILATLTIRFGGEGEAHAGEFTNLAPTSVKGIPDEPTLEKMAELEGWLSPPLDSDMLRQTYSNACEAIGEDRVLSLSQTSTLVGMVCPGLHSIYSSLSFNFIGRKTKAGLGYKTLHSDARYRILTMSVEGSRLDGEVTAVARQAPVNPPGIDLLKERVDSVEFAGVCALIVGGSRGLGAVTAGLIAAGGGQVVITYMHGQKEAVELSKQINEAFGPGVASIMRLDVFGRDQDLPQFSPEINQLYYFATPPIFRQTYSLFSQSLYDEFSAAYVYRFYDLCRHLADGIAGERLDIFYPSSVAVEQRPKGMVEYAMAKAAGELLCQDITNYDGKMHAQWLRIPRTATDQTATVAAVYAEDPMHVMLPAIRRLTASRGVVGS